MSRALARSWRETTRPFRLTITEQLYNSIVMKGTTLPSLDAAFSALSDPTRRAILARLALGETTVMKLAQPFEMTQPAISRHLKVLEGAGLIVRRVEGTKRPVGWQRPAWKPSISGLRCCGQPSLENTHGWP